jgi:hypothetical protein
MTSIPERSDDAQHSRQEDRRSGALEKRLGLTEAVRLAVANELGRMDREAPLCDRIAAIRRSIVAHGRAGESADKAFLTTSAATSDVPRRVGVDTRGPPRVTWIGLSRGSFSA